MESRVLISIVFSGILLQFCVGYTAQRNWDYELLSLTGTSSDESKMNITLKVQRVGRNENSISGVVDFQFDTDENTTFELSISSSNSGSESDYLEMPYKIPKMSFNEGMEKYYNDFVYKQYQSCSNLPNISGKFKGPFPRNTYRFNRCVPDLDCFPNYMLPAYYKFQLKMKQVGMSVDMYVKITSKQRKL